MLGWLVDHGLEWCVDHGPVLAVCAALAYPDLAAYLHVPLLMLYGAATLVLTVALHDARWIVKVRHDVPTRISHGLEHATLAVLEEDGARRCSGRAYQDHFVATVWLDGDTESGRARVWETAERAIARVKAGETSLAYSPRCSTSDDLSFVWTAVLILLIGLPLVAIGASTAAGILGLFIAGWIWARTEQFLGLLAQEWFTVTVEFESVRVVDVTLDEDRDGVSDFRVVLAIVPRAS